MDLNDFPFCMRACETVFLNTEDGVRRITVVGLQVSDAELSSVDDISDAVVSLNLPGNRTLKAIARDLSPETFPLVALMPNAVLGHPENDPESNIYRHSFVIGYDKDISRYFHNVAEGGYVVDTSDMPSVVVAMGIMEGPMASTALDPDQEEKCPYVDPHFAEALGGGFGFLAQSKIAYPNLRSLDRVSVFGYVCYWKSLGAKVGRKVNGVIVFDEEMEVRGV